MFDSYICAAMLVALAFLIQRPLVELQGKIARVREGDLSVSVNFAGRTDEIGQIGRDFNEMVRQMRQGREQAERLLAAANTQMTRPEHLATLGELAAGLAHEIRNPLAGIAGVIEIIGHDLPQTSPAREVLQEVQYEVLHIKRILSDLLDYARPRAPDFRLTDLNSTVEHAAALARQQALSRPIKIEVQRADGLPPVEHDTAQIQQVLLNLLLNAIQAIPAEGRVTVSVEARGGFAHVAVSDTGSGIAPEHLPSIFRAILYHQGTGHGPGAFAGAPDCRIPRWAARSHEPARQGKRVQRVAAAAPTCRKRRFVVK